MSGLSALFGSGDDEAEESDEDTGHGTAASGQADDEPTAGELAARLVEHYGIERAASELLDAIHDGATRAHHTYPRSQHVVDVERKRVEKVGEAVERRLDDLATEYEASERQDQWAWGELEHPPLRGHPAEEALRNALQAAVEYVREEGAVGADELYRAFVDSYRGAQRYAGRHGWAENLVGAVDKAPDVNRDARGLWSVETAEVLGDERLAAALPDALDASERDVIGRMYRELREAGPRTPWELGVAAGPGGKVATPETLREHRLGNGETPLDTLAELPGVEPPEDGVAAFRFVGDDGGESDP